MRTGGGHRYAEVVRVRGGLPAERADLLDTLLREGVALASFGHSCRNGSEAFFVCKSKDLVPQPKFEVQMGLGVPRLRAVVEQLPPSITERILLHSSVFERRELNMLRRTCTSGSTLTLISMGCTGGGSIAGVICGVCWTWADGSLRVVVRCVIPATTYPVPPARGCEVATTWKTSSQRFNQSAALVAEALGTPRLAVL